MKNIYLIGFMGAGKSTVASMLCGKYSLEFVEMDQEIEKEEGMSISEIFSLKGEAYFREIETKLLEKCAKTSNMVISCGGGTAMRDGNVDEMRNSGKIVFLDASAETVYERVKDFHDRPLLEGNMNISYIEALMQKRKPQYVKAADIIVRTNGRTVEEICEEIVRKCE